MHISFCECCVFASVVVNLSSAFVERCLHFKLGFTMGLVQHRVVVQHFTSEPERVDIEFHMFHETEERWKCWLCLCWCWS